MEAKLNSKDIMSMKADINDRFNKLTSTASE